MKTEDLATEFLLTFLALLVQLGSWVPPAGPSLSGGANSGSVSDLGLSSSGPSSSSSSLATGLAYSAGLTVHRGALNPARALGPAFVANRCEKCEKWRFRRKLFRLPSADRGGGQIRKLFRD